MLELDNPSLGRLKTVLLTLLLMAIVFLVYQVFTSSLSEHQLDPPTEQSKIQISEQRQAPTVIKSNLKKQRDKKEDHVLAIKKNQVETTSSSTLKDYCKQIDTFEKEPLSSENQYLSNNWHKARGHFIDQANPYDNSTINWVYDDYDTYELEALKELALQFDGKANLIMANKMMHEQSLALLRSAELQTQFEQYATEAIINGYSAPIGLLTSHYYNIYSFNKKATQKDRSLLIASQAWLYIAERRKDWVSIITSKIIPTSKLLDQSEKEQAKRKAETIYTQMEAVRKERGLEPFDNSYPDFMKPIYLCLNFK